MSERSWLLVFGVLSVVAYAAVLLLPWSRFRRSDVKATPLVEPSAAILRHRVDEQLSFVADERGWRAVVVCACGERYEASSVELAISSWHHHVEMIERIEAAWPDE